MAQISELQAALLPDLPNFTVRYFGRDHPRWLAMRDKLREGAELAPLTTAPGFIATLRPYQNHGLSGLHTSTSSGMGGVLADDMGLGKRRKRWRICIGCMALNIEGAGPEPDHRADVCAQQLAARGRTLCANAEGARHHGSDRAESAAAFSNADVVLTSYPLLQRDETADRHRVERGGVRRGADAEEREGEDLCLRAVAAGAAAHRPDRHADGEPPR